MSDVTIVSRATSLRGTLRVPGDKSASHRALMLSALADGESHIDGISPGLDVASTARIMGQLGAICSLDGPSAVVTGRSGGLQRSDEALYCGNSGTSMRLLAGLVSAIPGVHVLTGDESLSRRPMDRVAQPLKMMGSFVTGQGPRVTAPLRIEGSSSLRAIEYHVPMSSAQVKSAVLFAGLGANGPTTVIEDVRTRPTTEDMLRLAGVRVDSVDHGDGRHVTIHPSRPRARRWTVAGDPSQAAFFIVLGVVHPDAVIEVRGLDGSPERTGFLKVLDRMGANLSLGLQGTNLSVVATSSALTSTEVYADEVPSVDEVPVLVVAAAAARGESAFRNMGELRLKESNRFTGAMALAEALGCRVWYEGDDFFIEGLGSAEAFVPIAVDAALDHRMVMSSAVAGCAGAGASIAGAATVTSSYPHFFDDLAGLS